MKAVRPTSITCETCALDEAISRFGKVPRHCRRCRELIAVWGLPWTRIAIAAARVVQDPVAFERTLEGVRVGRFTDRRAQIRAIALELAAEATHTPERPPSVRAALR